MAFSALEALQAFGAGRQMALQDRERRRGEETYQRQETLRTNLTQAYDPASGQINPARARQAYVEAGDIPGALALDQHLSTQHGREYDQYRDALIAAPALLSGVRDESSYQAALVRARQAGLPVQDAPATYDPNWVQNVVTVGTRLQAAQHYQPPSAVQQQLESAGIRPGTPEYRAAIMQHLSAPRIMMIDGQPTLVDSGGGGAPPGAPTNVQEGVNPQTGERVRLNPQTNQWEPVAAGGPTPQASGGFSGGGVW